MIEVALAVSICILGVIAAVSLGCVNIFNRVFRFKLFSNSDVEGGVTRSGNYGGSLPRHTIEDETGPVSFEPLPPISPRGVKSVHRYRPRIIQSSSDDSSVPPKDVNYDVPRENLFFVKELGNGWFGQVLQGEAVNLMGQSQMSVVVCTLKDEVTEADTKVFHDEVHPYRCLNHRNVLGFLGHSKTTMPHLTVLEFAANSDLKTYLLNHRDAVLSTSTERFLFLKFAVDIASGLSCLHRHNFLHRDLSCRTCQVMTDLTIKVGDYGLSEELYKGDYINVGGSLVPLRWLPPECISASPNGSVTVNPITKDSNIWSLGVTLWELCSVACMPHGHLNNMQVIKMYSEGGDIQLPQPTLPIEHLPDMYDVMKSCWENQRPAVTDVCSSLTSLLAPQTREQGDDFDERWSQLASPGKSDHNHANASHTYTEADELESDISFITQDAIKDHPSVVRSKAITVNTPERPSVPHITSTPMTKADSSLSYLSARSSMNTPDSTSFATATAESFSIQNLSHIDASNDSTVTLTSSTSRADERNDGADDDLNTTDSNEDILAMDENRTFRLRDVGSKETEAVETPLVSEYENDDRDILSADSQDELNRLTQSTEALSIESGIVDGGEDTDESECANKPDADMTLQQISEDVDTVTVASKIRDVLTNEANLLDAESSSRSVTPSTAEGCHESDDASTASDDLVPFEDANNTFKTIDASFFHRSSSLLFENSPLPSIPEETVAPDIPADSSFVPNAKRIDHQESFDSFDTYEWDDVIGNELIGQVNKPDNSSFMSPGALNDLQSDWTLDLMESARTSLVEDSLDGPVLTSLNGINKQDASERAVPTKQDLIVTEASTRM